MVGNAYLYVIPNDDLRHYRGVYVAGWTIQYGQGSLCQTLAKH